MAMLKDIFGLRRLQSYRDRSQGYAADLKVPVLVLYNLFNALTLLQSRSQKVSRFSLGHFQVARHQ